MIGIVVIIKSLIFSRRTNPFALDEEIALAPLLSVIPVAVISTST
jgi:hypothetical protein